MTEVRIVAAGDAVLVAEFDERIDVAINARAVAMADELNGAAVPGVRDVVPTFRSVAVHFDPLATDISGLVARMQAASAALRAEAAALATPIEIPVCYDAEFGPDLDDVARVAGLGRDDVIAAHTGRVYRVYMLGFLPGFAYLGRVDERIAAARRATPRLSVPTGSVGIAGLQTGIYPQQTPGGWNIVGRTPLRMAWLDRAEPTRLKAGDTVRFRAIGRGEFERLAAEEEGAS